jgi:hypothetical protein
MLFYSHSSTQSFKHTSAILKCYLRNGADAVGDWQTSLLCHVVLLVRCSTALFDWSNSLFKVSGQTAWSNCMVKLTGQTHLDH